MSQKLKEETFWNEKGSLEKGVMLRSSKTRMKTPSFDLVTWTWRKSLKKSARVDVETGGPWEVGLEWVEKWVGGEEADTYLLHHWPRHWFNFVLNKHYVRDNTALGKRWRISFLLLSGSSQSKWGDKQASTFSFPFSSQNILKQALFSGVVTIYQSHRASHCFSCQGIHTRTILVCILGLVRRASQGSSCVLEKHIPVVGSSLWDKWNPTHPQTGLISSHQPMYGQRYLYPGFSHQNYGLRGLEEKNSTDFGGGLTFGYFPNLSSCCMIRKCYHY